MYKRGEILRDHYVSLLKKFGTWAGLVALLGSMFVSGPAMATGELSSRSATLSTSVVSAATDTLNLKFTFNTSGQTVGGFGVQICDSPLPGACANTGTSSGENFSTASAPSVTLNSGTWANSGTCTAFGTTHTGNLAEINCTAAAITATPTVTLNIPNVTNPSAAGEWYIRVTTYTANNDGGTATDFGAMAVDTANQMSESATVQESLNFAVGTTGGTTCASVSGSGAITMSNSTPLQSSTVSDGTGAMCANTNAGTGYVITYAGTAFSAAGGTTFPNTTQFSSAAGTTDFGFNEVANTTPSGLGTAVAGAGTATCTADTNYCTANKFSYSNAGGIAIADSGGTVTADNVFTLSFVCNIDNTVKYGAYSATQTFIATGTF